MIPVYLILIFITYDWTTRKYLFSNNDIKKNIAIAEIIKVEPGARTAPTFEYFLIVNQKRYNGSNWVTDKIRELGISRIKKRYIGKKFLVRFVVENPNYSELLINKPVNDSTLIAPEYGWPELPF